MSFGWSAGDIFAAVKLLIDISQALSSAHGSPKDHAKALSFVNPIKNGLEQLLIYAKEEEEGILSSDDTKVSAFRPTVQALEPLIKKFTEKVLRYSGLQEDVTRKRDWLGRQFDKLKWHFVEKEDLLQLRQTIEAHFAFLSALYPKMILTVLEFHEGKSAERDADILSVSNSNAQGISNIYSLLTQMWTLQEKSAGSLLILGPDAGVNNNPVPASKIDQFDTAAALLLVQPHVQPAMTDEFAAQASKLRVQGTVVRKLKFWLSDPTASLLWIYGQKSTSLSAIVFEVVRQRNRPAVAYPCRHYNHVGEQATEEDLFVGLIYSIIYQLLQQLPQETILDGWTSKEKLGALDGTFSSVGSAIGFLSILLKSIPNCVCIIDGLQYLCHTEKLKVRETLGLLLKLFRAENGRLLLTSSGATSFLASLDESFLDRHNVSKDWDSGQFVLVTELMGVNW